MLENPDMEQGYYSSTASSIYEIGRDSIRSMNWICYYDRSYYENLNYYNLRASICKDNIDKQNY